MDDFEPKKLIILRLLEILKNYSDSEHRLTYSKISELFSKCYGIDVGRKTLSRNVDYLARGGYNIVSTGNGVYCDDRTFEYGELRLLIDSVLSNRYINQRQSADLIKKLTTEGGKHFSDHTRHIVKIEEWQKSEHPMLMLAIEQLDDAIGSENCIQFFYNRYLPDKKLHPRSNEKYIAHPYKLVIHGQKYYLIAYSEKYQDISFFRVDLMSDIETDETHAKKPLEQIPGYENGLTLAKISNNLPYMFGGDLEIIEFEIDTDFIGHVIDWFGMDFTCLIGENNTVKVKLAATPAAMEYWLLQYGKHVKVLSPQSLVDTIRGDIALMSEKYSDSSTSKT